jgi:hypothetical protein
MLFSITVHENVVLMPMHQARHQFVVDNIAFAFFGIAFYAFANNLCRCLRFLSRDHPKLVPFMCALQCVFGLIAAGLHIASISPLIPISCEGIMQTFHASYTLSYILILIILITKSYCTSNRSRTVQIIGILVILINLGVQIFGAYTMGILYTAFGCTFNYSSLYHILRPTIDILTNAFLLISMLAGIWQHLRFSQHAASTRAFYRLLLQDGLIYGVSACVVACMAAVFALHNWIDGRTSIVYTANCKFYSSIICSVY